MEDSNGSIHVAMYPWFAFGHLTPFLHLSNKLAERGHKVSFLLPKGTIQKFNQLNQYPHLIHFFPVVVPTVHGLPPGAENTSDVPFQLHNILMTAMDETKDQVRGILSTVNPDFVFYDFAYWVPSLCRELGFRSISYTVVCAAAVALRAVPAKMIVKGMTFEELMEPPRGYPSSSVLPRPDEVASVRMLAESESNGLAFYERLIISYREADAIAMRTYKDIEGPFCEYIARQYGKTVLLTGPVLPETPIKRLEEKWAKWLNKFEKGSVVYCAFGSQIVLKKDQFQELLLGFESCGLPFLVALTAPEGCSSIEEALPEGFEQRNEGRGWVCGEWVPQPIILDHPSVGCFVSHCGFGSMWESLLCDCQIVLVPHLGDQILNTMIMAEELKVAVEVKREENGWISKKNLCKEIKLVMDKDGEVATMVRRNHEKWRALLSAKDMQETCVDTFIKNLKSLPN